MVKHRPPRARRGASAAVAALALIALVVTATVVSTGYPAQRLDLGDGAVWVANSQQQAIGRANTEILELNSVVSTAGTDLEVLQGGSRVLMLDRTESAVDIINPATSEIADTVPMPPNQTRVFLAAERVVIFEEGTGELWIVAASDFADFDSQSPATLSLGTDSIVSVDPAGRLFAYSPAVSQVYALDIERSSAVESTAPLTIPDAALSRLSISSINGAWVVLDSLGAQLYFESRSVDLAGGVGVSSGAILQTASASGDRVLVAHNGGLVAVPLSGAEPVVVLDQVGTAAAAPFRLGECEFAAWASGVAWRGCPDDGVSGAQLVLQGIGLAAQLEYVANGNQTVLNDRRSGQTWAVQRSGELIDNWDELIVTDDEQPQEQQNNTDNPPEVESIQVPPVAVSDSFGARPGQSTVVPVLLNDYDANGDVLVVSDLVPIDEAVGRIELINERQQIQVTLTPGTTGEIRFPYSISDGRGGIASAEVTITIRSELENSPPQQVRATQLDVESNGRVSSNVLSDWVDPDGDPFYLTSAFVAAPDTASYQPGGQIVYSDSGSGSATKAVALVVSDGTDEASGTVAIKVSAVGEVPIIAEPFVVLTYAGQEITIEPLNHARGGSGIIRLNSVPNQADATITPSYETGTFRFVSADVRTHYLDYVVTDGNQSATGTVRIDVAGPPDANTRPITIPKTVFVQTLRNERVDVAGTDIDPAGGVLLVTGISGLSNTSGVQAQVIEQRIVRVSLEAPLDDGPVSFNYRISNGLAESEGVITVIEIPTPRRVQPPIALDDSITVRVGDAIDIPVLGNDEHPDGLDLRLDPVLARELPSGAGLLFASGNQLRYLAPTTTGNFIAEYRVVGPDGQAATAQVRIAVREADVATNNPPVPTTVTARVLAGETVRIRVALTGTDPDGDSVQLLGQSTNPEKGAVTAVEDDTIVYEAGSYSAGTDTFSYTVIDALGARATGTVRVGISARSDGARNPVAIVDEVVVRPGVTVSVEVLANDSDPDGSPLAVTSVEPNDQLTTAEIVDDLVRITPPETPGQYGVIYTIENEFGGSSQNFVRVTVDPDAEFSYPVARDSVLTLSDIIDRETVTVNVLSKVFFADGDPSTLGLSIYEGFAGTARVTSGKQVEVTIGDRRQIIPFKVTHPDDSSVFSYAFIRVPGLNDALPQIDRRAEELRVISEDTLVIDLNDYVIAVGGSPVQLTDASTVRATFANGDELVRDANTLVYTSADKYFGPASISFEVTDGASATDPAGRTAILVLPISVDPRENQAPVFAGAVLEFEPGQEREFDLLKLTNYPYPDDLNELVYSVVGAEPQGFRYALAGSALTLRADASAVKGAVATLSLGVRDDLTVGQAGRIQLTIVPSTRPLVRPGADTAVTIRNQTTVVNVLANDEATNPFPGQPLRVVNIRGLDGASLPTGVTVSPSADQSALTVTVSASAQPIDANLQYQVADATNDSDRFVWSTVRISVQDRPDPVSNVSMTSFGDRSITVRWNAGPFNNSPISNYRVATETLAGTPLEATNCSGTTCTIATPGNGQGNAVRVTVVATNSVGDSDPSALGGGVWSDIIPAAPTGVSASTRDGGLSLRWNAVDGPVGGSAVNNYRVSLAGFTADVSPAAAGCADGVCEWNTPTAWALSNGTNYGFTISARNEAFPALSTWNSSSGAGTPSGPPLSAAAPTATAISDTAIVLDWSGSFTANGSTITEYRAFAVDGPPPSCSTAGSPTAATSFEFSGLSPNQSYSFVVFATNAQGCAQSATVSATTVPGVITALDVGSGPEQNGAAFDFRLLGGSMSSTALDGNFVVRYSLSGGSVQGTEYGPVSLNSFLTADGTQYGQATGVRVAACRADNQTVCGAWSGPFSLGGVPVDPRLSGILFVPTGDPIDNTGTFSWTGFPTGAYSGVQVACGPNSGVLIDASLLTCDSLPSTELPTLTVIVSANGQTYSVAYQGVDYVP